MAAFTVRAFLAIEESPNIGQLRAATGTEGIPVSQVRPVTDVALCRALNEIVQANASLQEDATEWIRYYYRVDDFIFVFYRRVEFALAPSFPFHIFDKDLNLLKSARI